MLQLHDKIEQPLVKNKIVEWIDKHFKWVKIIKGNDFFFSAKNVSKISLYFFKTKIFICVRHLLNIKTHRLS